MSAVDVCALQSHPFLGKRAEHYIPVHVGSYDEAVQILANMVNGQHYAIHDCCHRDAS